MQQIEKKEINMSEEIIFNTQTGDVKQSVNQGSGQFHGWQVQSNRTMYDFTQWKEDLTKDIRFHDSRDDMDDNDGNFSEVPNSMITVHHPVTGIGQTMTVCNMDNIKSTLLSLDDVECILEIGVDCNGTPTDMTSTRVFLAEKKKETIYIGVDLDDKTYLDDPENNVFTLKTDSTNIEQVMEFVKSKGVKQIDYLFIDGWHSINQVLREWEYTKWLSPKGVVGFHDTKKHPGPAMFMKYIDTNKWNVSIPCDTPNDYGVGFVWRK